MIGVPAEPGLDVLRVGISAEEGVIGKQLSSPPYAFLKPGRVTKFSELFCVAEHSPQLSYSGTGEWIRIIREGMRGRGHASIVGPVGKAPGHSSFGAHRFENS
jgi:hypothetical protein